MATESNPDAQFESIVAPAFNPPTRPGLKKVPPYWYPYTTMAKGRWLGRELLEIVSTEFRDRSMEYYRYALQSGVTTVNGKVAAPNTIVKNGDRIENVVHRHEPPVTSTPVQVLFHDVEREFIVVNKPGSIPVHASGRYFRNSLIEILQDEFGFDKAYPVNRLDRLTSGLMIIPLSSERARMVAEEFAAGSVKKEYIARCKGEFPEGEVVCEQPLLTVDRQMGLNIVHPEGKHAKTIFERLHYDANTNTSVLHCRPVTGRSHQIRVHLQYLGHPIANDSVYSEERIWGPNLGKGGIDTNPSDERMPPAPPAHMAADIEGNPESVSGTLNTADDTAALPKLLPRETGEDIGMGSPVPLSLEAVGVITRLRNMKDEDEDWSRWRDVVFRAKGSLNPRRVLPRPPPIRKRGKGGPPPPKKSVLNRPPKSLFEDSAVEVTDTDVISPANGDSNESLEAAQTSDAVEPSTIVHAVVATADESSLPTPTDGSEEPPVPVIAQLTTEEALSKAAEMIETTSTTNGMTYCPECYLPLHPDPKPEKLYIFLHALRYTTSLGCFETEMPEWSAPGWTWDMD